MGIIMEDISNLSLKELIELQTKVEKLITQKQEEEKNALLDKFKCMANELGLSLEEVLAQSKQKKKQKAAPKFQNPDNEEQTWTGRGPQPKWFKDALNSGYEKEDLLIK